MNLEILAATDEDYDAAIDYYLDRSEVAARSFVAEFEAGIEAILNSPIRWQRETETTRRYRLPNYPYSLIYRATDVVVIVVSVAHNRRRPAY